MMGAGRIYLFLEEGMGGVGNETAANQIIDSMV